tara:strand:+ start:1301 stop:3010 length:1710 start_codon:yes stop_codon:yes gene_type:complete
MTEEEVFGLEDRETVRKYALQNALEYCGQGEPGSVLGRVLAEKEHLRVRVKGLLSLVNEEVTRANSIAREDGIEMVRKELESFAPEALDRERQKKNEGLKDLPGNTSEVILRFAPNPNGPLSLGHSRGVAINSLYAEKYQGKIVLRFDDTDTKVKPPMNDAYGWIEEEFEWMSGRAADVVIRASERMPIYLQYAEKMLIGGFGYVCKCNAEDFREFRISKTECPCRYKSVQQNMEDWGEMNSGEIDEGGAVVRVKTGMDLPNPALRDWPALRIQHSPHPLVGDTYKVWPLLDFQSAIEDHLQGVSHIIRGKDLMDSTRKQTILYEHFGWDYPESLYWGRVKIHEFGGFSTSKMSSSIDSGEFSGWDDPRLPTIRAMRRRGFDPRSLAELWGEVGLTQKDISISMKTLESFNSRIIDGDSERRVFVSNPKSLDLSAESIPPRVMMARHPDGEIEGFRVWEVGMTVLIQDSDFVEGKLRLKDFADIKISGSSATIESIDRSDERKIVHWIPEKLSIEAIMSVPDGEEISEIKGVLEEFELTKGEVYQLERVGFAKFEGIQGGIARLLWLHD